MKLHRVFATVLLGATVAHAQPVLSQSSLAKSSPSQPLQASAHSHSAPAQPKSPGAAIELRRGLVITKSVRVLRKVYALAAPSSADSAVIVIRGDNLTVDFDGAELRGAALDAAPDAAAGVAIRIEGGKNVHVLNAKVRGYRFGIMAVGTHGLTLTGNDLSYNWKPRLFSLVEHESLVDWMSFHHNEQREWLRFGAGVYLDGVVGGEIAGNTVEQSMNGLMLTRTDSLNIHDNTFAYNSGLGIGMYRSAWNNIFRNVVDYNVRGYSDRFFRRGQDSAGLLMFEQSSHNVVAWNSITHGGDGLFLWAGQTTMDTGEGGANDNLYFQNDFSFAPTNGMEATFARNDFIGNRIEGSDHGLWGGYSYSSRVIGNCFAFNRIGIAIEHGQDNTISRNWFNGDSVGVRLWADSIEPSDWGYPKHRDTKSRDYLINNNTLATSSAAFKIANTSMVDTSLNTSAAGGSLAVCDAKSLVPADVMASIAGRLPKADAARMPTSVAAQKKRDAIVVDEWGPFDWRSPKLWPVDSTHSANVRVRVLGPPGNWKLVRRSGITSVSSTSGRVGDTITVIPASNASGQSDEWKLSLEYQGEATVSPRGVKRAKGSSVAFSYEAYAPNTNWKVGFFVWADSTDPRKQSAAFSRLLQGAPMLTRAEPRLDYFWYRSTIKELPQAKFALVATTRVTVPAGAFTLRTISDDAIRVWVDGKQVIDNWTPHESAVDNVPIAAGPHDVRVEYVQVDGWTELRVEVVRGVQRSTGSAGPH